MADQRSVFSQFAKPGGNRRRNQNKRSGVGAGIGIGVISLHSDPVREGIRGSRAFRVLIAHIADACTVALVRGNFAKTLIVVREGKDNDPGMVDRVTLEHIKRIHCRYADAVGFMAECKGAYLLCQQGSGILVACCSDSIQFGIAIRGLERLSGTGALARTAACHDLQVAPWMLIRRMPEERRWPAR